MAIRSLRLESYKDVRWEPLYDTYQIPASALTILSTRFFSLPIGTSGKTQSDTNMVNQGSLPSPQAFRCYGLRMEAFVHGTVADTLLLQKLAMDSYVRFFVGTKDYFTAPLSAIMGKIITKINGQDVATGVPTARSQFGKASHYGYKFPKEQFVDVAANENFGVEWSINTASITPSAAVNFKLYLEGLRAVDVR